MLHILQKLIPILIPILLRIITIVTLYYNCSAFEDLFQNMNYKHVNGMVGNFSFSSEEEEEEIKMYLVNGTALLEELRLINSHVYSLLRYLNDTTRDEESYGMKVAHVVGEMMSLHDSLADLEFDEANMRHNLSMTDRQIDRAKDLYYDSINHIYNFNKLVGD